MLDEELLQWREGVIGAEERVQQLPRALDGKRAQPYLRDVRRVAPGVCVFGTVGREEQQARGTEARDETIEDSLRLGVDPVKVFEDQEDRLLARFAQQQSRHRVERAPATFGGIERSPLGLVVKGNVEQGEQRRQGGLQRFVEREHLARHLFSNLAESVAALNLEVAFEEIDHRQITRRLAIRDRCRFQDRPAPEPKGGDELIDQA